MSVASEIAELVGADDLDGAIDRAGSRVRDAPKDAGARGLLIDCLILAGDYERADKHCALAASLAPEDAIGFARIRAELRAMAAREAFYETGAVPDFPGGPSDSDQLALRLSIAVRENNPETVIGAAAALEEARGTRPMNVDGRPVDDLRDMDDRVPHALEVLTSGGSYLWIDLDRLSSLMLHPMERPRDLAFRRAELKLIDGSVGPVLVPMIYHGTANAPGLRLGRRTAWEEASGITVGRGQRCFLTGDRMSPAHEIATLAAPDAVPAGTATPGDEELPHG